MKMPPIGARVEQRFPAFGIVLRGTVCDHLSSQFVFITDENTRSICTLGEDWSLLPDLPPTNKVG